MDEPVAHSLTKGSAFENARLGMRGWAEAPKRPDTHEGTGVR